MNKHNGSKLYEEAILALFSSLNLQVAVTALKKVLGQRFPLETIFLHLADRETQLFRVIADARETGDIAGKIYEIPAQFSQNIHWYQEGDETGFRLLRKSDNEYATHLLNKYGFGFADNSVYWTHLALDKTHFGGVSLILQQGYNPDRADFEFLDLLIKPLTIALANALSHEEIVQLRAELTKDNQRLRNELFELKGVDLVYETTGLSEVAKNVKRVARHDTPVLVLGETGVGKEVVANSIHNLSRRREKPFITVNCGALPENLADSYLFGHEKGAFTGANQLRKGYFERADNGTLFLDEVGELSLEVQVKLLRILETKTLERVGGHESISVNVRIIAATHRDLMQMVSEGKFREDLWYRLNIYPVFVPPLRHRKEDIPELINYFLAKKTRDLRLSFIPKVHQDDLKNLIEYNFPGNVRELQNIIERSLIYFDEEMDEYLSVQLDTRGTTNGSIPVTKSTRLPSLDEAIKRHIMESLKLSKNRIQGAGGAAELLDIHPSTLRAKIKKLNIKR